FIYKTPPHTTFSPLSLHDSLPIYLWTKLKATDPLVEFRSEPKMQMVISCQRPLDMWNLAGRIYQNVLQKPDLVKVIKLSTFREGDRKSTRLNSSHSQISYAVFCLK